MSLEYLLALHSIYSLLGQRLNKLMEYFGDAEECWNNEDEWADALGLKGTALHNLLTEKRCVDIHGVYETFLKSDCKFVTLADDNYPQRLRNICDPPYLFYYKGKLPSDGEISIAMIGSRRATSYGLQATEYISRQLAEQGATIVSGLARGIDSAGHRGALAVGGTCVGVLGCGVDVVHPPENRKLFDLVKENGCIISEFPLGTNPIPRNFVVRNRLVSGLADGVVVVEATKKSGTQITVDYALEQGKNIFAVPGPIFSPLSQGTHKLIRDDNFKLVTCADDILCEFEQPNLFENPYKSNDEQLSLFAGMAEETTDLEKKIWDYLVTPKHFNEITVFLGKEASDLAPVLTVMELRGYITRQDGQYYTRKNQ